LLGKGKSPMAQTNERDLRHNPDSSAPSALAGTLLPLIVVAILAAIVIVMAFQRPVERAGDTNAGPSVQTVTSAPSPSTEPRPTQAPQP
jgi:hypothetical protein